MTQTDLRASRRGHDDDDAPSLTPNTPTPTSQLTPDASVSGSAERNTAENVMGRGLNLSKLQTDLPDDDDQILQTGSAQESDSNDFDQGSEDEDIFYSDRRGRGHPYSRNTPVSRSFTAEEERRVVKKFDRKLVPLMALLYMLAFLDRSSKSCHTGF